jgi:hypothetical protein
VNFGKVGYPWTGAPLDELLRHMLKKGAGGNGHQTIFNTVLTLYVRSGMIESLPAREKTLDPGLDNIREVKNESS